MTFSSRIDAGIQLARYVVDQRAGVDLVLGLPRGGVIVAAEVSRILDCPMDALLVRKIGHPRHREFAVGAIAEDGTLVLDPEALAAACVDRNELEEVVKEETRRLAEYRVKFHRPDRPALKDKSVLIVDDGLATGATMEAAARSARNQRARRVLVAAPVASDSAVGRLDPIADQVLVLRVDPEFDAVGRYYQSFPQATDAEVQRLLGIPAA
jgi:putative phosphoribosyl transferase